MKDQKKECPHCYRLYYPIWKRQDVHAPLPSRRDDFLMGRIWATTCTACDEPIIEFRVGDDRNSAGQVIRKGSQQVYPIESEIVIQIIVQVFIDLEKLRRRQSNEPDMTDEEETASRTYIWEFLKNAFETVKTGSAAAQVISKYLPFFRTLFPELPPPTE